MPPRPPALEIQFRSQPLPPANPRSAPGCFVECENFEKPYDFIQFICYPITMNNVSVACNMQL